MPELPRLDTRLELFRWWRERLRVLPFEPHRHAEVCEIRRQMERAVPLDDDLLHIEAFAVAPQVGFNDSVIGHVALGRHELAGLDPGAILRYRARPVGHHERRQIA